jgi:hypothetical protein
MMPRDRNARIRLNRPPDIAPRAGRQRGLPGDPEIVAHWFSLPASTGSWRRWGRPPGSARPKTGMRTSGSIPGIADMPGTLLLSADLGPDGEPPRPRALYRYRCHRAEPRNHEACNCLASSAPLRRGIGDASARARILAAPPPATATPPTASSWRPGRGLVGGWPGKASRF